MSSRPVLYIICCAAPPAREVTKLVALAHERAWEVCVLTTPSGRRFVDDTTVEQMTGHPLRSEYKHPGEPDVLSPADAIIVAPAS